VKFLNVARTVMSNIVLTAPNPSMLVKKITALDAIFIEVMRDGMLTRWERKILLDKLHGIEVKPDHFERC